MNKTQVALNTKLVARGWVKADILLSATEPGVEAIVYKAQRNVAVTYPDGSLDRLEGQTTKLRYRVGWYSPADRAKADSSLTADRLRLQKGLERNKANGGRVTHAQFQTAIRVLTKMLHKSA